MSTEQSEPDDSSSVKQGASEQWGDWGKAPVEENPPVATTVQPEIQVQPLQPAPPIAPPYNPAPYLIPPVYGYPPPPMGYAQQGYILAPVRPARPKQGASQQATAIFALIGACLLIFASIFWGLIAVSFFVGIAKIVGSVDTAVQSLRLAALVLIPITLTVLSLTGGIVILYHSIRSLIGKRSPHFVFPGFWIWVVVYVAIIVSGYALQSSDVDLFSTMVLPLLLLALISVLPAIGILALATRRLLGTTLSWRQGSSAFLYGAAVVPLLLVIILLCLRVDWQGVAQNEIGDCVLRPTTVWCGSGTLNTFLFLTLFIPIVEEALKALLLLLPLRYIRNGREAFLIGLTCGVGYGYIESIVLLNIGTSNWLILVCIIIAITMMQGLCSGWMLQLQYPTNGSNNRLSRVPSQITPPAEAVYPHHPKRSRGFALVGVLGVHILFNACIFSTLIIPDGLKQQVSTWHVNIIGGDIFVFQVIFLGAAVVLGGVLALTLYRMNRTTITITQPVLPGK